MKLGTILKWVAIAFVLWWVIQEPTNAAHLVHNIGRCSARAANGLSVSWQTLRLAMGIRVVPNETVPATVYRILLPHERRVITVRFHPAILIRPVAWTLGGLAIAGLLSTTFTSAARLSCSSSGWPGSWS